MGKPEIDLGTCLWCDIRTLADLSTCFSSDTGCSMGALHGDQANLAYCFGSQAANDSVMAMRFHMTLRAGKGGSR
jgi:hypothetical protein